jgi:spore coat protein U-like protein
VRTIYRVRFGLCLLRQSLHSIRRFELLIICLGMLLIRASAADSCYPVNSAQMIFGSYSPEYSQAIDMDTNIDIYCAPAFQGQKLNVRVNLIDKTDQDDRRVLQNTTGGDKAYYILFQDAARTIPLRDDMAIPVTESVPSSKLFTIRLYGRLLPKQNLSKGIYMANLIVNIDY